MPASTRLQIKMQQIARMRVTGIKDVVIASTLQLSNSGLQRILRLPDYIELEEAILNGHLSKMDETMSQNLHAMKTEMSYAVPLALRTLVDACAQKRELRTAIAAAAEILDRDPKRTFAKGRVGDGPNTGSGVPAELLASVNAEGDGVAKEFDKIAVDAKTAVVQ